MEPGTGEQMSYDGFGNVTGMNGAAVWAHNPSTNQSQVTGYSYDGNGNVLTDGTGQTYTWDVENRMTGSYQSAGGQTTATFSKVDTTTQGTWKGTYGANGSAIAVDSTNYPSYAQVTVSGTPYTWVASRPIREPSNSTRARAGSHRPGITIAGTPLT